MLPKAGGEKLKNLYKNCIPCHSELAVKKLISEMLDSIRQWHIIAEDEFFAVRLICNELVANSIFHGNKGFSNKTIKVTINALDDAMISITVRDEGVGFDYKNSKSDDDIMCENGRGLMLISEMSEGVEYNENGSSITVFKQIG